MRSPYRTLACSATLLGLALAEGSAAAAPWPVDLAAPLPAVPSQLRRYIVDPEPVTTIDDLRGPFSLVGEPETVGDDEDPYQHLRDAEDHAYVYLNGGATFHDTNILDSETKMNGLAQNRVWTTAEALLNNLGMMEVGPTRHSRYKIGKGEVKITKPTGAVQGPFLVHQTAVFTSTVDGLPTFGAGGETTVTFGANYRLGGFTHGTRHLVDGGMHEVDPPEVALQRMGDRADLQNRFNLLKVAFASIERVEITSVRLGYFVAPGTSYADTVEPAYEVVGLIHGYGDDGNPGTVDLLWYEPALQDGFIADHCVSADPDLTCGDFVGTPEVKPVE